MAAWALRPVAAVYGLLMRLRRRLYQSGYMRSERLPVPVLVIGNVVVGGVGKTPTVIAVLQHLQERGWVPGVISRGHGRRGSDVLEVRHDTPAMDCGDEPALIRRRTGVPVWVGARRVEAGRALLNAHPEVNLLVCDDGLQHWALQRDLAIAVFDERGIGNGWLLPAGLLREPWPPRHCSDADAAWRGPDLVLRHGGGAAGAVTRLPLTPELPCFEAHRSLSSHAVGPDGSVVPLHTLKAHPITAVAGIARPEAFFDMLRQQGLTLQHTIALPDHAPASAYECLLPEPPGVLVCTEKDAVKCFAGYLATQATVSAQRVWSVPLELRLAPAFLAAIDKWLVRP